MLGKLLIHKFHFKAEKHQDKPKMMIYEIIVKSRMIFGSKIWQISEKIKKKSLSTVMDFLQSAATKLKLRNSKK